MGTLNQATITPNIYRDRLDAYQAFLQLNVPHYDEASEELKDFLIEQMDYWNTVQLLMSDIEYSILGINLNDYNEHHKTYYQNRIKKVLISVRGINPASRFKLYSATVGRMLGVDPMYKQNKKCIDNMIASM